jgi:hypothetical protein
MALGGVPATALLPLWKMVRAVCPLCGEIAAHRTRRRTARDYLLGVLGLRAYRCEACSRRYHATKWLRLLAPAAGGAPPPRSRASSHWVHRYRAWRIREGRHAHRFLLFGIVLLAIVGGFFLALCNAHLLFAG